MRPEAPSGGRQDGTIDLQSAGFLSTGAICAQIGLWSNAMPVSFIVSELGIEPRIQAPNGRGFYWAPEQMRQIRQALIRRLLEREFAED